LIKKNINIIKTMEYLDKPALDDTPRAHPAYFRGKANGINSVLKIVSDVMMGLDNGSGANNHPGVEQMRRALLIWREELAKKMPEVVEK
jgi:hypothetical protein